MDVSALAAHVAIRGRIGPVKSKKTCRGRVQLSLAMPENVVLADLAAEGYLTYLSWYWLDSFE
jgi:hypothetical protein